MSRRTARAQIKAARARQKAVRRTVESGNNNADAYPETEHANPSASPHAEIASPNRRAK